ncbi:MAG: hypothetical protein K9K64_14060 [Desulfohalobiaceae bacterium]|nr:hypothetical protein [Desulfohalobiaceae bacterium]
MKQARLIILVALAGALLFSLAHAQDDAFGEDAFGEVQEEETELSVTSNYHYIDVDGDKGKFREHFWTDDGSIGGVERFFLKSSPREDTSFTAEGHAQFGNNDYGLELRLDKEETGYLRGGFSEYRKYFDDSGGFFEPFPDSSFDLNRDLELDIGKFYLEAGLTRPDWPKIRLTYEHHFKDGEKSLTRWGGVTQSGETRNIFPAYKDVDQTRDTFIAEIDHTVQSVRLRDRFLYESFDSKTTRFEQSSDLDAGTSESVTVDQDEESDRFFNTFYSEMNISKTVYASLGYLYSNYEGDADFDMVTVPFNNPFDKNWSASQIDLDQNSHLLNLNLRAGPYSDVSLSGGIQGEWGETEGDTDAVLTEIGFGGGLAEPVADIFSDKDSQGFEENLSIRYTGLPRTTLYGEGRWSQYDIDLLEREFEDGNLGFERDTDTDRDKARYKTGFSTSPIRYVTLSAHYKREKTENDYDHLTDTLPDGYSAFILSQDITTDEVGARISLQPRSWVRTSFAYRLQDTETDSVFDNDPSEVMTGNYDAHVYTLDITLTPVANLFLSLAPSYWDIRGKAHDNGVDSVIPYEGDVFSTVASANYALDAKTRLWLDYTYSRTKNFTDNSESGLPLLLDDRLQRVRTGLSRKLSDNLEAELVYNFFDYDGNHNNGLNDYDAHLMGLKVSLNF